MLNDPNHKPLWIKFNKNQFELAKLRAIEDFWVFLDVIDFMGGSSSFGDCHRDLVDFVLGRGKYTDFADHNSPFRKLVLMPRGHLKSTLLSVGLVLWRIYRDPNIRILVGTSVRELAVDFVRTVKQYLEDEDLKRYVWNSRPHIQGNLIPELDVAGRYRRKRTRNQRDEYEEEFDEGFSEAADKKVVWSSSKLQVVRSQIYKEPTLRAASVGTSITGHHYDLLVLDDLVTFENSDTITKAERITDWGMDAESVVNPYTPETQRGEQFIILGTRYYKWDYYGHLTGEDIESLDDLHEFIVDSENDNLEIFHRDIYRDGNHYTGKVSLDYLNLKHLRRRDTTEYLWPEGFNETTHKRIIRRLTPKRYASQYLNQIIEDTDVVLFFDSIHGILPQEVSIDALHGLVTIAGGEGKEAVTLRPVLVVDPAASLSDKADYSVVLVGAVDKFGHVYLLDIRFGRWTPAILHGHIVDLVKKYGLRSVNIESVGYQVSLVISMKRVFKDEKLSVWVFDYKPKGEKKSRIEATLEPLIRSGRLHAMSWMFAIREFRDQIEFFPSDGVHDDIPDTIDMLTKVAKPLMSTDSKSSGRRRMLMVNRKYGGLR